MNIIWTKSNITVCVRPLFDSINVLNLLEFIAYYHSNGITNVVFYYYDFANLTELSPTAVQAIRFLPTLAIPVLCGPVPPLLPTTSFAITVLSVSFGVCGRESEDDTDDDCQLL
ncbi:hypothetical protein TYRP_017730 [Tyrophagus putrescentiae]|nr:hypothetical protein TYRP_017730 [Tyrophagus putrescentiae]